MPALERLTMAETIEGRNAVAEALRSGALLTEILIADGVHADRTIDEIRGLAKQAGVTLRSVPRADLDARSGSRAHQGVIATVGPFRYSELTDVLGATAEKGESLLIVLDHVTDPGNLGAVIRSAEVAGADAVIVPRDRSATVTAVVHKASAGAVSHLRVARVANIARALSQMKDSGYWVAGADESAPADLWSAPLEGRTAIVLGSEGSGLSRLVRERCDYLVRIPVSGKVSSLNVAQAASVLAFEWVRRKVSAG